MNKFLSLLLTTLILLLSSSCLTFRVNHILEKFIEYPDVDFNHVRRVNIITNHREFGTVMKDFIYYTYRNRGITIPPIHILEKEREGYNDELNFHIRSLNYVLKDSFVRQSDTKEIYTCFKKINCEMAVSIYKSNSDLQPVDLTFDSTAMISRDVELTISRKFNSEEDKNRFVNERLKLEINKLDRYDLFYNYIEKILKPFMNRLIPVSRELLSFKTGLDPGLLEAYRLVKSNKLDEALLIWEAIYSDPENTNHIRSIASYNIAILKALNKDYDQADLYFNRAEELEEKLFNDLIKL